MLFRSVERVLEEFQGQCGLAQLLDDHVLVRGVEIPVRCANILSLTCHCEGAGVRWTPLQGRSTDRAGRRDRKTAAAIRLPFKGIMDSFTLRVQNDKPFSHRKRRKARGNPSPPVIKASPV